MRKLRKIARMARNWFNEQTVLAVLFLMLLLSGCVTTTASSVANKHTTCGILSPITWSVQDTDDTIRQVKVNNAKWKELCGKKTP